MKDEARVLLTFLRRVMLMYEAHRWSRKARRLLCEYPSLAEMAMANADAILKQI